MPFFKIMNQVNSSNNDTIILLKSKKILIIGISLSTILFLLGLTSLFYLVKDYQKLLNPNIYSYFFNSKDDTATLGALIAASTGLLWSLAGIILFAFSLFQTKMEIQLQINEMQKQGVTFDKQMKAIKRQNKTSILQQKENTLNFIISNYTNTIKSVEYYSYSSDNKTYGYRALNELYNNIKNKFNYYVELYNSRTFPNCDYLKYQYDHCLNDVEKNIIDIIINNFKFFYDHIINNFKDNPLFYFQIYNNSLSIPEKYFIGLYLVNSKQINLNSYNLYDFTSYYKFQSSYNRILHHLPLIDIGYHSPINQNYVYSFNNIITAEGKAQQVITNHKLLGKLLVEVQKQDDLIFFKARILIIRIIQHIKGKIVNKQ